ncbi:hypothetical protein GCM10017687_81100 [Streptomyces echinatus]
MQGGQALDGTASLRRLELTAGSRCDTLPPVGHGMLPPQHDLAETLGCSLSRDRSYGSHDDEQRTDVPVLGRRRGHRDGGRARAREGHMPDARPAGPATGTWHRPRPAPLAAFVRLAWPGPGLQGVRRRPSTQVVTLPAGGLWHGNGSLDETSGVNHAARRSPRVRFRRRRDATRQPGSLRTT